MFCLYFFQNTILLLFLHLGLPTLPLLQKTCYKQDALVLHNEKTVIICDIFYYDDSSLLVADAKNRCVKALKASCTPNIVFQCRANSWPRAIQLVGQAAPGDPSLLLVECFKLQSENVSYALVVAKRNDIYFYETDRFPLSKLWEKNYLAAVSMYKTRDDIVLIGNQKSKELEVFDARYDNIRVSYPIELGFVLNAFSVGIANEKELLAATENLAQKVHLMHLVVYCGSATVKQLYEVPFDTNPEEVLLFGSYVLLTVFDASTMSRAVHCHTISDDSLSNPQVLNIERKVHIECWRRGFKQVLLFDTKHNELQSLDCDIFRHDRCTLVW